MTVQSPGDSERTKGVPSLVSIRMSGAMSPTWSTSPAFRFRERTPPRASWAPGFEETRSVVVAAVDPRVRGIPGLVPRVLGQPRAVATGEVQQELSTVDELIA